MKNLFEIYILILIVFAFTSCEDDGDGNGYEEPTFSKVTGFVISEEGKKILATDNGLFEFDESEKTLTKLELANDFYVINDLSKSQSDLNEIWIASVDGVLNVSKNESYTSINSGLSENNVDKLNIAFNQNKYFAVYQALSMEVDGNWIEYPGKDDLYASIDITDIGSTTDGYVYVTTNGGGVERFTYDEVDGVSGATIFDTDWSLLKSNSVNTVYTYDTVQVYGTKMGVAFHYSSYTKWDWKVYTVEDGLVGNDVKAIGQDKNNTWWFGTTEGLSSFNQTGWKSYTVDSHKMIDDSILFIDVDKDNVVWIVTELGIAKLSNNSFINFPFK